ncbi:carbohydrate esterase family 1 protein [Amanita muscaria Koide BX008]|uniref:Carbohydrate esterase family 1 protein n=1 Tax=Amanita muscaria (strain Koide BX008) TaxID=946122 RepID=A0A0C2WYF6_AMAMK|nr:carbohydrate esterase family 1 protein [Amanita muscaria Koide BX008]
MPSSIAADSQFNALADKEQIIVAYPSQSLSANPSRCWNWFFPADQARGSGEPAIIAGIAQTIQNNTAWNFDKDRIYVVGLSSGAAMSVILGVAYPDVFAAIGVGSGNRISQQPHCLRPRRKAMGSYVRRIPTIVFHGTADTVVPEIHGQEVVISMGMANALADPSFTNTNFYAPPSDVTRQVDSYTYSAASWNDVTGKPVVQFYLIYGMNHAWSGGAPPLVNGAGAKIGSIDLTFCRSNAQKIVEASPIDYIQKMQLRGSLFEEGCTSGAISTGYTEYYIDHEEPLAALQVFKDDGKWCLGELLEGHEFLIILPV